VKLAAQVLIGPLYHPVMLAEEIATLDIVTEGRLVFGIGLGYRREEFDYFGVSYKESGKRLDETLKIVKQLWTEDEVSHNGEFWQLDQVRPHIRPIQEPHPTIWVGAHAIPGVRRAGRFGDAYACPPETPLHEVAERYEIVAEEFAKRSKPFGPQPLRRNTMIARTDVEAAEEYARVAQGRYISYSEHGLDVMDSGELQRDFLKAVGGHAVIGTHETVTSRLVEIVESLPVEPLLLRPQWPTQDADEAVAAIRALGEQVIPTITALDPSTAIDLKPHDQAPSDSENTK
jgi:alkanesulfonate monooxygenase SsuD/methylene tetrahydromethanopterin reductase-like flavin-dependent oxidoreductase (luciferase family)